MAADLAESALTDGPEKIEMEEIGLAVIVDRLRGLSDRRLGG